jgi:hypothetical protein
MNEINILDVCDFNNVVFDNVLNFKNVLNICIFRVLINQSFTLIFDLSLTLLNFSQLTTIIAWNCLISFEIFTSTSLITLIYCWKNWHFIKWWNLKITFVNDWSKNLKCSQFFLIIICLIQLIFFCVFIHLNWMLDFLNCIFRFFINQCFMSFIEIFDRENCTMFALTLIIISTFSKSWIFRRVTFSVELKCINSVYHLIEWIFKRSFDHKSFSHVFIDIFEDENCFIYRELLLMCFVYTNSILNIKHHFFNLSCFFNIYMLCNNNNENI